MPAGIIVTVDGGLANVDFVDPSKAGPGLTALLNIGGPDSIRTITRRGARRTYQVPTGNAIAAGLIDHPVQSGIGHPKNATATGGTGTSNDVVIGAGDDSGYAQTLQEADPNTGVLIQGADGPAAQGEVDWHAPTSEYTSRNAFEAGPPMIGVNVASHTFTGAGTSIGGDITHAETQHDLIERLKAKASAGVQAEKAKAVAEDIAAGGSLTDRPDGLPVGDPNELWKRNELNTYATWKGVSNPAGLATKAEVLAAIANA